MPDNQGKETTKPVTGSTYPQLPNAKATSRPGSILNRQGGSVFDRPEHINLSRGSHTGTLFKREKVAKFQRSPCKAKPNFLL